MLNIAKYLKFHCQKVESTRNGKLRRLSGRFQTLIWRPGETVQNLEYISWIIRESWEPWKLYERWDGKHLPCEQRLHFRSVTSRAKSSLCWQPFNFLTCMCEIRHVIHKQNQSSAGLSSNGTSFAGIKKLRQLWYSAYARRTQDSHNALNWSRTETGKTQFFNLFVQISRQIWTVVGRGYFSHNRLTQRKCSLSQGRKL